MLMMLGLTAKPSAADAHDAGPVWGLNGTAQLMLMMLGRFGGLTAKPSAADAHDAGPVWGLNSKPSAADAHDAGPVWGLIGKTQCS